MLWEILGRIREARVEVVEAAEGVCSVRIVVVWPMQELDLGERRESVGGMMR